MTEILENQSLSNRQNLIVSSGLLSSASCVLLEGDVGRVLPGLGCPAAPCSLHHCPEAQPRDGGVGLEPHSELFVLAPLYQETLGQVGAAQPHPSIVLNLNMATVRTRIQKYSAV